MWEFRESGFFYYRTPLTLTNLSTSSSVISLDQEIRFHPNLASMLQDRFVDTLFASIEQ